MGDSILSQAEIDALLNGDSEKSDDPKPGLSGDDNIRPYDPNTQRRVVRERLQALEIINERFARQFRMGPSARSAFSRTTSLPATCRCQPTLTLFT